MKYALIKKDTTGDKSEILLESNLKQDLFDCLDVARKVNQSDLIEYEIDEKASCEGAQEMKTTREYISEIKDKNIRSLLESMIVTGDESRNNLCSGLITDLNYSLSPYDEGQSFWWWFIHSIRLFPDKETMWLRHNDWPADST